MIKHDRLFIASDSTKRWRTTDDMLRDYAEYCDECRNHTITKTVIDRDTGLPQEIQVKKPRSRNITGWCLWAGISKTAYYNHYVGTKYFGAVCDAILADCEQSARGLFEDGEISPSLAGLWMGAYGYSTRQEQDIKGGVPVVIAGEDKLED